MSVYPIIAVAVLVDLAVALAAFFRPDRVFLRSAIAAMCTLALLYVAAYTIGRFLAKGWDGGRFYPVCSFDCYPACCDLRFHGRGGPICLDGHEG